MTSFMLCIIFRFVFCAVFGAVLFERVIAEKLIQEPDSSTMLIMTFIYI
jgi:hypothetical protein